MRYLVEQALNVQILAKRIEDHDRDPMDEFLRLRLTCAEQYDKLTKAADELDKAIKLVLRLESTNA